MTVLLDSSLLIALVIEDHLQREPARRWFAAAADAWATCPITQGAVVRTLVRVGMTGPPAAGILSALVHDPRHEFWPDDLGYSAVDLRRVRGHRQVTDAYLAGLARHHGGRLATFDRGLALAQPDVVDLVPT